MTVTRTANPRRTTLAALPTGSVLHRCDMNQDGQCHNVATRMVDTATGRRASCASCAV